jgi:hypothetical protein
MRHSWWLFAANAFPLLSPAGHVCGVRVTLRSTVIDKTGYDRAAAIKIPAGGCVDVRREDLYGGAWSYERGRGGGESVDGLVRIGPDNPDFVCYFECLSHRVCV